MKTLQLIRTLAIATLLGGAPLSLFAQGPLNPPGPPAPTMKTLVEVEPRIHIKSLPFTITSSGSYYLTTNLNGGGTALGIVIQASGVTLDLRGFSIENCTSGISATGAGVTDVAIHNGMVRGCTGAGIDLGAVSKVRLEDVIVCDNGGDGASVGGASLVTLCTAKSNGAQGILIGDGGKIFQCVAQSNGGNGIAVASTCQATGNNCNGQNFGAGLLTIGNGNRVEGNSANQNKNGFLINGTANLVIQNNACSNAAADYSVSAGNNYGQILVSPGAGFANANPWANFGCGTQGPGPCVTNADCDDGNVCTTDVCQANVCSHTPIPDCGMAVCGNGIVEVGEQCDGVDLNGQTCVSLGYSGGMLACNPNCTVNVSNCTTMGVCGDGIINAGEACDDGNLVNGDGCNSSCQLEGCTTASQCPGVDTDCQYRTCNAGTCGFTYAAAGAPVTSQIPGDCKQKVCDGAGGITNIVNSADIPDDGNQCTTDYCNAGNPLYSPSSYGAPCNQSGGTICNGMGTCISNAVCGDGIVQAGESCDDGNTTNGDGCTAICSVQSGYTCSGSPSVCTPITYTLTTARNGSGSGTITSAPAGINCGVDCSEAYSSGTLVTLTAASASGSTFSGWSGGGCSGTGTCNVTMSAATSVTATFTLNTYTLSVSKSGTGAGTVTSSPAGISCGNTCNGSYSDGTMVTLTATPQVGSSFAGWSGACTGTGSCTVTMTLARSVDANFFSAP